MGNKPNIITISGPVASGRTTLANGLVNTYGFAHLNQETVLRRIAEGARSLQVPLEDVPGILKIAASLPDDVLLAPERSKALNTEKVRSNALELMAIPELGAALSDRFKKIAIAEPGLVAVGTLMNRQTFPDAQVKIFLDAPYQMRVSRISRFFMRDEGQAQSSVETAERFNTLAIRRAVPEWELQPVGRCFKEKPVREPADLADAMAAHDEIYFDAASLSADRLKAAVMVLIGERLPEVKTIAEQRKARGKPAPAAKAE